MLNKSNFRNYSQHLNIKSDSSFKTRKVTNPRLLFNSKEYNFNAIITFSQRYYLCTFESLLTKQS